MTDKNVLLVGSPGAGKTPSNFARLLASMGEGIIVLDPHRDGPADDPTDLEPAPGSEPIRRAEALDREGHSPP